VWQGRGINRTGFPVGRPRAKLDDDNQEKLGILGRRMTEKPPTRKMMIERVIRS
jgi:hypothetical protein